MRSILNKIFISKFICHNHVMHLIPALFVMSRPQRQTPIEHAYLSMCDRINRLSAVYLDPYIKLSEDKKQAIKQACEAIEEEWIIEPSMRAPRD